MARARLYGISVSPGCAMGTIRFLHREGSGDRRTIASSEVAAEQKALFDAAEAVRQDLADARAKVPDDLSEYREVIDAQIEITRDPKLVKSAASLIASDGICAAWALAMTVDRICEIFRNMDDDYLKDRAQDIRSVGVRIRSRLCGGAGSLASSDDVILAAEDISPADVMALDLSHVRAIVTVEGGITSHSSILARGMHIPALVCVTGLLEAAHDGERVIVDGLAGHLLIAPSEQDSADFSERISSYTAWQESTLSMAQWPADTTDGQFVTICANIEHPSEAADLVDFGADGIGLYRTEFAFLKDSLPGEEELYREYAEVLRKSPGATVFRTLDAGADKLLRAQEAIREPNPTLGLRGVRFTLRHQDIFRCQLRALLRAGVHGRMSILIPLVTTVDEVRSVRRIIQEVTQELRAHGIPHAEDLPLGVMVETPAAVLIADELASESDFFSIGTNDLIHYLIAIDRNNRHVAYLNDAMHPAVVRSLKRIIDAGHRHGISVCACGELSSDPFGVVLMLGMGIDSFSAAPAFLPGIKHLIRRLSLQSCKQLAGQVLTSSDVPACKHMVNELLQKTLGPELAFHTSSVMGTQS